MIPVNENERRYCFFVAYSPYISSVPLSEPNVFAELSKPANTVVIIIPVFQVGFPNGNNSKLIPPPEPPLVDSTPKISVCAIQPTIIPINKPYLRTLVGALILIIITRIARSEEHTSELQSRFDLVCRLLLEKKNK